MCGSRLCETSFCITYGRLCGRNVIWSDGKTGNADIVDRFICSVSVLKSATLPVAGH